MEACCFRVCFLVAKPRLQIHTRVGVAAPAAAAEPANGDRRAAVPVLPANPHALTHTRRWTRLLLLQQLLVETIELLDPAAVRVPRNRRVVLAPVRFRQPEELEAYKWVVRGREGVY